MLGTGIVKALLHATEKLDFEASRVTRHLAAPVRGDRMGARFLVSVGRSYTRVDELSGAHVAHSHDRSGTRWEVNPVRHNISVHGADSRHHIPGFSVPDWTWDEKNVYRRWDGAVAVPPDDALTEGHLIVVADGPSGASVEARVAYAAELAAEHSAANVITCRRGLGSDFGPVHVMPRTRDDGLKLHWSKQQGGKIHDKLLPEEPCIFDKIIDGNIPAEVTKRWDNGMAFVPLDPVKDGKHQLVVATEHTRDIGARVGHDGTSGPDIAAMTMRNFVDLTRDMVTSRGVEATQSAPHTHFHAVERDEGDGLELMTSP